MSFDCDVNTSFEALYPDMQTFMIPIESIDTLPPDSVGFLFEPEKVLSLLAKSWNHRPKGLEYFPDDKISVKKHKKFPKVIPPLPEEVSICIYKFLNGDDRQSMRLVCLGWRNLHDTLLNKEQLKLVRAREIYMCTNFETLDKRMQKTLLKTFNPDNFHSIKLSSISKTFLDSDATKSEAELRVSKSLLVDEIEKDPILKGLLHTIFHAESEHSLAYQPFYHAMSTTVFLFGFSVKMLLQAANKDTCNEQTSTSFHSLHWFRFPQLDDSTFPQTVEDFFSKSITNNKNQTVQVTMDKAVCAPYHGDHDDHHPDIKKWIMAVNPLLFSNFYSSGESTFELFSQNKSVYPPDKKGYFNLLCDHFHLLPDPGKRAKYAEKYDKLLSSHCELMQESLEKSRPHLRKNSPQKTGEIIPFMEKGNRDLGVLCQIFVPKPLVDRIVYPCKKYGIPENYRNKKMSAVYKEMCANVNNTENLSVQARIMTSPLVCPGNNIKVLTHGHADFFASEKGDKLKSEFLKFFTDIVADSTS